MTEGEQVHIHGLVARWHQLESAYHAEMAAYHARKTEAGSDEYIEIPQPCAELRALRNEYFR